MTSSYEEDGGTGDGGGLRKEDLLVPLAAFLALTAAFFLPLLLHMGGSLLAPAFGGTSIFQQARDKYHFIWNFWWVGHAIATRQNVLYTRLYFYPQGTSLVLQTIDYVDAVLASALGSLVGEVAAYNLVVLASFPLAGVATFLLAWHLTHSKLASLVSGFIYAFFPQHVAQAIFGHPNISSVEWLPAYLLVLMLAFERRSVRYAVLAGVLLAVMTMVDLEWLIWAGFATVIYLAYVLAAERPPDLRNVGRLLLLLAVVLVVGVGLTSPYLIPAYKAAATQARPPPALDQVYENAAIPRLFLTPFPYNAFFGSVFSGAYLGLSGGPPNWMIYIGWTVIALAAFGAVSSHDKRKYFLLALAAVFFLFSLGPSRTAATSASSVLEVVQAPYTFLYNHVSILHYLRSTARFSIAMMLAFALLAGMGADRLFKRLESRAPRFPSRKLVAVVILALLVLEYAPAVSLEPVVTNPVYRMVAADPGNFGVLELPNTITLTQFYLYEQTLTGKSLVNGKISQVAQTLPSYMYTEPFLRELSTPVLAVKFPKDIIDQPFNDTTLGPAIMTQYGIKYVILNPPDFVSPKVYQRVFNELDKALGPPVYQDSNNVLFELPQWTTTTSILEIAQGTPLSLFGYGWGPITSIGRTAANDSQLFVYATTPGLRTVTVNSTSTSLCVDSLNFTASTTCGALQPGTQQFVYQVPLAAGKNVLNMTMTGGPAVISYLQVGG